MVIAAANTGRVVNNMKVVTPMHHKYKYRLYMENLLGLFMIMVVIKFIAPKIELIPAKCRLKIIASMGASREESGG